MNESELQSLRERIDQIDDAILQKLEERLYVAQQIAYCKEQHDHVPLTDPQREHEIIQRLQNATQHPILRAEVATIFGTFMQMSKQVRVLHSQDHKT